MKFGWLWEDQLIPRLTKLSFGAVEWVELKNLKNNIRISTAQVWGLMCMMLRWIPIERWMTVISSSVFLFYVCVFLKALSNENQQLVGGGGTTTPLASEMSSLEESTFKVGKLSVEQRKEKIHRYMKKRNERNFSKKIKVISLSLVLLLSFYIQIMYRHTYDNLNFIFLLNVRKI